MAGVDSLGGKNPEEEKIREKLETYQYIIDSAYILFDGKYSMNEIESMPYKDLLTKIENEQKLNKEIEDARNKREQEIGHTMDSSVPPGMMQLVRPTQ